MTLKFVFSGIGLLLAMFCNGQSSFLDINFELQVYPTGIIPGVRIEGVEGLNAVHFRFGYNWIRHGDHRKHEDERGQGFGLTFGHKRYFKSYQKGWYAGLKNDFWFNEIDWKNNIGQVDETNGYSEIIVVQPTAEFGYIFQLTPSVVISPNIAFGYEVNIKTSGEQTGDGAIFLIGFQVGKRIDFDKFK